MLPAQAHFSSGQPYPTDYTRSTPSYDLQPSHGRSLDRNSSSFRPWESPESRQDLQNIPPSLTPEDSTSFTSGPSPPPRPGMQQPRPASQSNSVQAIEATSTLKLARLQRSNLSGASPHRPTSAPVTVSNDLSNVSRQSSEYDMVRGTAPAFRVNLQSFDQPPSTSPMPALMSTLVDHTRYQLGSSSFLSVSSLTFHCRH